jgi:transcriptional regulator with XRE-family HTH domain
MRGEPLSDETGTLVGRRLREYRLAKNLSMETLAQLCGFSKETVRAIEAGEQVPRLHTFVRIVRALDIGLEDLLPADWRFRYAPGPRQASSRARSLAGRVSTKDVSKQMRRRDRTA